MTLYQVDETTLSALLFAVWVSTFIVTLATVSIWDGIKVLFVRLSITRGWGLFGKKKHVRRSLAAAAAADSKALPVTLGALS